MTQQWQNMCKTNYIISMTQVLTSSSSPTYFKDNLSETSTGSYEPLDHLDLNDSFRAYHLSKVSNSKAKSSLCRNFMERGLCPYGNKCQFAHGTEELKCNKDQQMAYKTRQCHSFLNNYFCQYGSRCNFVHQDHHQKFGPVLKLREFVYSERGHGESRLFELVGHF